MIIVTVRFEFLPRAKNITTKISVSPEESIQELLKKTLDKVKLMNLISPTLFENMKFGFTLAESNEFILEKELIGKLTDASVELWLKQISPVQIVRYCMISHQWSLGLQVEELAREEDPDAFIHKQPITQSSVLFKSEDGAQSWTVYATKGQGKLKEIKDKSSEYLPNPSSELMIEGMLKDIHRRMKKPVEEVIGTARKLLQRYFGNNRNGQRADNSNMIMRKWCLQIAKRMTRDHELLIGIFLMGMKYPNDILSHQFTVKDIVHEIVKNHSSQYQKILKDFCRENPKISRGTHSTSTSTSTPTSRVKQSTHSRSGSIDPARPTRRPPPSPKKTTTTTTTTMSILLPIEETPNSNGKRISVQFTDKSTEPWGNVIQFNIKPWSITVFDGSQSMRLGIRTGDKIIEYNNEEIKDGNREAIREKLLSEKACTLTFLREEAQGGRETFVEGDEVIATWTDGDEYNARIIHATEKGYLVDYYEHGEQADQAVDTIRKNESFQSQMSPKTKEAADRFKKHMESKIKSKGNTTTTFSIGSRVVLENIPASWKQMRNGQKGEVAAACGPTGKVKITIHETNQTFQIHKKYLKQIS